MRRGEGRELLLQSRRAEVDADPEDLSVVAERPRGDGEPGLGPTARRREDDSVEGDPFSSRLVEELLHRGDVAARPHRVRPAVRDDVRTAATRAQLLGHLAQSFVGQAILGPHDLCSEEPV